MLTAERLRALLEYDPATGIFLWKARPFDRRWSARHAGKQAGWLRTGYIVITIEAADYAAHRLAWLYMSGKWPSEVIDHADLDRANNRWSNLREATQSQNTANQALRARNKCGFKGVTRLPGGRYRAQIKVRQAITGLGVYDTPEEAHAAYCAAAVKYFGEFARAA